MHTDAVDRMIEDWAKADPTVDARPLEVVGRLLLCAQYSRSRLSAALHPLELSFGDFDVINTLRRRADPRGSNPTDLAHSSLVTSGAMTARIIRLERAGLVQRTPDPADGRAVRVKLTPRGERLAIEALKAIVDADWAILAPLRDDDRDALAAALKSLLLHLEHH
jgi:DNA-binding MarR family transcriptional regulator